MTTLKLSTSKSSWLRGADSLLVIAPRSAFADRSFGGDVLPSRVRELVVQVASQLNPGDLGATGETWTGSTDVPHVEVAVLPDGVSRYHAPSRPECVRSCVAAARRRGTKLAVLAVLDVATHALPVANAIARGIPGLSLKSGKSSPTRVEILLMDRAGGIVRADPACVATIDAARLAAELVDRPPTDLDPARLAAEARKVLRGIPHVTVLEIRGDDLLQHGLGGIHAVGRAAMSEPRLLIADYKPPRDVGPHIALVGKGVTYDTGGLHLKARGSMETMKGDMGGSAAVLGAFRVLASTKSNRRLTLLLCLAENAIGPKAYKPDDVLAMHSGKTVEINNTDAEGRLLLADGVSFAARKLRCSVVLDAATLTGAQMIATGDNHAAIISNDEALEHEFVRCGRDVGDLVHPLPYAPEFYQAEFKSPIADMRNSVKNRSNAQTSCAAQFIASHLEGTDVRWGHVDLAGPSMRNDRGTGFGVALLAEVVRRLDA